MTTRLYRHAAMLVTMDELRREIPDGGLFVRDGYIEQAGPTSALPQFADETFDLSGCIVLPGLINTHHHFYQTLTRAVPAGHELLRTSFMATHERAMLDRAAAVFEAVRTESFPRRRAPGRLYAAARLSLQRAFRAPEHRVFRRGLRPEK